MKLVSIEKNFDRTKYIIKVHKNICVFEQFPYKNLKSISNEYIPYFRIYADHNLLKKNICAYKGCNNKSRKFTKITVQSPILIKENITFYCNNHDDDITKKLNDIVNNKEF